MKKYYLVSVLFMLISFISRADGYTATLQHGENVTAFYGVDAFKEAYVAAVDSDAITLSAGSFSAVDSVCKSITIRGNYAMGVNDSTTFLPNLKICANNVWIDGIYISFNLTLSNILNCKISHSWIEGYLTATRTHTNTIIDQCVVKNESANTIGVNYSILNSAILKFSTSNTSSNLAYICNCIIYNWYTNNTYVHVSESMLPYAIYKNNLIGFYDLSSKCTVKAPNEFYYNTFFYYYSGCMVLPKVEAGCIFSFNSSTTWGSLFSDNSESYPARILSKFTTKGQDGTVRGPNGGKGFSYYPSVPRITSATIAPNTNSDGKLSVKISVSVQK